MKLSIENLRILAQLNCYDSKYDLMIDEIEYEEKQIYITDNENLKEKIEDWFFDWIGDKTSEIKISDNKYLYFYTNVEDVLGIPLDEENELEIIILIKNLIKENNIRNVEDFYRIMYNIFEENNYNPEEDDELEEI